MRQGTEKAQGESLKGLGRRDGGMCPQGWVHNKGVGLSPQGWPLSKYKGGKQGRARFEKYCLSCHPTRCSLRSAPEAWQRGPRQEGIFGRFRYLNLSLTNENTGGCQVRAEMPRPGP